MGINQNSFTEPRTLNCSLRLVPSTENGAQHLGTRTHSHDVNVVLEASTFEFVCAISHTHIHWN